MKINIFIGVIRINVFENYLNKIENKGQRQRVEEVLNWVKNKFPNLKTRIAWNQPMFTDHGTFIIGFSISKKHMAVAQRELLLIIMQMKLNNVGMITLRS